MSHFRCQVCQRLAQDIATKLAHCRRRLPKLPLTFVFHYTSCSTPEENSLPAITDHEMALIRMLATGIGVLFLLMLPVADTPTQPHINSVALSQLLVLATS